MSGDNLPPSEVSIFILEEDIESARVTTKVKRNRSRKIRHFDIVEFAFSKASVS